MQSAKSTRHWKLIASLCLISLVLPVLVSAEAPTALQTSLPAIGQPFPIANVHPNTEDWVSVAYDEDRRQFLVVNTNNGAINATCLTATGSTIATYVVGNGSLSDVAYNKIDDQYMVVFQNGAMIEGNTISGSCCLNVGCVGAPFAIADDRPVGVEQYEPAIAYNSHANHHDYLVVWADWTPSPIAYSSVYGRRLNADRTFDASSFAVAEDDVTYAYSYEPDIAYNLNRNEWLIVYTRSAPGSSDTDIFGRRYFATSDALEPSEEAIDTSANNQNEPAIAAYRPNTINPYLVVFADFWNDTSGDVRGYLVNADGASTQLVHIATVPGKAEWAPAIASSEGLGGYTVVWTQNDTNTNIYGRGIDNTGSAQPTLSISLPAGATANATNEGFPAVAGGSPLALAVWEQYETDYDIYGRLLGYVVYIPLVIRN